MKIPGKLNKVLEDELFIWRPIMAKVCSLEEIKSGVYTLVDLLKINALLDMEIAIQNANAPKGGRKH